MFDSTSFEEIEGDLETASRRLRELQKDHRGTQAPSANEVPAGPSTQTVESETPESSITKIHVVDLDIPLTSLIWLFGKAALAAVPAGTLLAFFWMALSTSLPGIFDSVWPW
jgi:hypothetical protein